LAYSMWNWEAWSIVSDNVTSHLTVILDCSGHLDFPSHVLAPWPCIALPFGILPSAGFWSVSEISFSLSRACSENIPTTPTIAASTAMPKELVCWKAVRKNNVEWDRGDPGEITGRF
jgi:hypothetical protein